MVKTKKIESGATIKRMYYQTDSNAQRITENAMAKAKGVCGLRGLAPLR
jgi:hypothetical protein